MRKVTTVSVWIEQHGPWGRCFSELNVLILSNREGTVRSEILQCAHNRFLWVSVQLPLLTQWGDYIRWRCALPFVLSIVETDSNMKSTGFFWKTAVAHDFMDSSISNALDTNSGKFFSCPEENSDKIHRNSWTCESKVVSKYFRVLSIFWRKITGNFN